jgi:acyl-CoA thioesterase FadM
MSALVRNLLTALLALWRYGRTAPLATVVCRFWVTPWDVGLSKLKSDRVLQMAEAAQLDYMVQTGLLGTALKRGYAFVNAAQMLRFMQPVGLFSRVTVHTRVMFADAKWVYFEHTLHAHGTACAQVWVKMKFKHSCITMQPNTLLGEYTGAQPVALAAWDLALAHAILQPTLPR